MENKNIDIINLIEKNPVIQLSSDYQNKFIIFYFFKTR